MAPKNMIVAKLPPSQGDNRDANRPRIDFEITCDPTGSLMFVDSERRLHRDLAFSDRLSQPRFEGAAEIAARGQAGTKKHRGNYPAHRTKAPQPDHAQQRGAATGCVRLLVRLEDPPLSALGR